jgi:hypothetical protein
MAVTMLWTLLSLEWGHRIPGHSQVQQEGPSASAPGPAHIVSSLIVVMPFNPNPQTPIAIKVVKRMRAISPSLEGQSPVVASPRVTVEALRLDLDVASSDSTGAARQQSSVSALEHSRSDRPTRGWVCTLSRTTPAVADVAAVTVDAMLVTALGHGMEEAAVRGGSSSPLPPRATSPTPHQVLADASHTTSSVGRGDSTSSMCPCSTSATPAEDEAASIALTAKASLAVDRDKAVRGGVGGVGCGGGLLHQHPLLQPWWTWWGSPRHHLRPWAWLGSRYQHHRPRVRDGEPVYPPLSMGVVGLPPVKTLRVGLPRLQPSRGLQHGDATSGGNGYCALAA